MKKKWLAYFFWLFALIGMVESANLVSLLLDTILNVNKYGTFGICLIVFASLFIVSYEAEYDYYKGHFKENLKKEIINEYKGENR